MTGNNCEGMNSFECWLYNSKFANSVDKIGNTIGNIGNAIGKTISDAISGVWNAFMQTLPGKILGFIRDIITFLLYGVKSLILLIWNLIYTILNGFINMFTQINSTFYDLSYFMGTTTSMLISLFTFVLLLIGFGFLFRFFVGKFHYNRVKK